MPESFTDLHFPYAGLDLASCFDRQPTRQAQDQYARTTPVAHNVRAFDSATGRMRGGSRPGLSKWCPDVLGSPSSIQDIVSVTVTGTAVSEGMQDTRSVVVCVVAGGKLYTCTRSAKTTKSSSFVSATAPVVFSADNGQVLYYVDGKSYKSYDVAADSVATWTASGGSLPANSAEKCRIVETWRSRTCLSGLRGDDQNWFVSAVGNGTDFDYSPASTTPTQAIAGNNSALGKVGDNVTGLIPWSDDVLLMLGDRTIWMMSGDPMAGGSIDSVSRQIGGAFGRAWCIGPDGTVYFFGVTGAVYSLQPGNTPFPLSWNLARRLEDIDLSTHTIRMEWDRKQKGFHLLITTTAAATLADTHYFWDQRTGGWFDFTFGNRSHNPKCMDTYDGDLPDDRAVLLGSFDGYLRFFDADATRDDGTDITSEVWIGPILTPDLDEVVLKDMQAILAEASGDVTWAVYVGRTAEEALASGPVDTEVWAAGRSANTPVRRAGHAIYVALSSTDYWAMEAIRCRIDGLGKVRRRA